MKTERDLRQIALGLLHNKIYSDWMIEDDENVPEVFQRLYLSEIDSLILQTQDIGMIYEYVENGTPDEESELIFSTFHTLTKEEAIEVARRYLLYTHLQDADGMIDIPHA